MLLYLGGDAGGETFLETNFGVAGDDDLQEQNSNLFCLSNFKNTISIQYSPVKCTFLICFKAGIGDFCFQAAVISGLKGTDVERLVVKLIRLIHRI